MSKKEKYQKKGWQQTGKVVYYNYKEKREVKQNDKDRKGKIKRNVRNSESTG